ncbi:MAG: molecular chaperone DnaK, partial [Bacteroidales bacterium]
ADKKEPIEKNLEALREAHKNKDVAGIDTAMESLNTAWQAASTEMYQGAEQGEASQQQDPDAKKDKGKDEGDVTDVDYEEVK